LSCIHTIDLLSAATVGGGFTVGLVSTSLNLRDAAEGNVSLGAFCAIRWAGGALETVKK
jgi:hypothetical protein